MATTGRSPAPVNSLTPPVRAAARPPKRSGLRFLGALLLVGGAAALGLAAWAMQTREPVRIGVLIGSDLPAAPLPAFPDAGPAAPGPANPDAPAAWPAFVQGRPPAFGTDGDAPPATAEGLADGWYLWSDFAGWHIWAVGEVDGSIEITTNGTFLADTTGGPAELTLEDKRIVVGRGAATEQVVGVNFNPGFFANELTVTIDGDAPLRTGFAATDAAAPLTLRYARPG